MICKKCGAEFSEGIFCPECGTKIEADYEEQTSMNKGKEQAEKVRLAKEKVEADSIQAEKARLAKEKAEADAIQAEKARLAKEKAEVEAIQAREKAEQAAREREELEARTYKGVVYSDTTQARLAKDEDDMIDNLKSRLLLTKKQQDRRKIVDEFKNNIQTPEVKKRLDALKMKAHQNRPKAILYNYIYGLSVILSIIITLIMGVSGLYTGSWENVMVIVVSWYAIGIPVWIVWKIVLVIKSHSPDYYLNIKDI